MKEDLHSKITKEEIVFSGKWLGLKYVDYTIGHQTVNNYEKIYLTTSKPGKIDSVDIIPIIQYKERPSELIMIAEFRPPVHGYVLQFPTGMAEDTNYEENARR